MYRITNSALERAVCQFILNKGTCEDPLLPQRCSCEPVSGEYTVRIPDGGGNWAALRVVASFDKSQEDIEDTLDIHRAVVGTLVAVWLCVVPVFAQM